MKLSYAAGDGKRSSESKGGGESLNGLASGTGLLKWCYGAKESGCWSAGVDEMRKASL